MKLKKRNGIYYLYEDRNNIRSLKTRDRGEAQELLQEAKQAARDARIVRAQKIKHISLRDFRVNTYNGIAKLIGGRIAWCSKFIISYGNVFYGTALIPIIGIPGYQYCRAACFKYIMLN